MPDDRLLHRRLGRSEKVSGLSDFEYRVWTQYLLSADDCGIMPFTAAQLQADNDNLRPRPVKAINAALARLVGISLIRTFEHQRQLYAFQPDWQDFQGVRYPRDSHLPLPCGNARKSVTKKTERLYVILEELRAKKAAELQDDSGKVTEIVPAPAHAGGIAKRPTANGERQTDPEPEKSTRETATLDPAWRKSGSQPLSIAAHQKHAFCSAREGLCVPEFLHREFVGKLGGAHSEAQLLAWYPLALEPFEGRAIGENSFTFWRNLFAAWVGTATSAPTSGGKGSETVSAVQRVVLQRQAQREGRS